MICDAIFNLIKKKLAGLFRAYVLIKKTREGILGPCDSLKKAYTN